MTSHDVVNRLRRLAGTRKIGHLGTLDPLATGVLPLVIGRATRLARFFERNDKKYEAVVRFGWATTTYDREGEPTTPITTPELSREAIQAALQPFRGAFLQTPPPVSAKKIGGVAAYKLARKNVEVAIPPVEVNVYALELHAVEGALARISIHCSAGTYVRGIAHEAGLALGCGAHLESLRRTAAGDFDLAQARTLDQLAAPGAVAAALIPAARLLPQFPTERVDLLTAGQIRQGRPFRVSPFRPGAGAKFVKAVTEAGELIAIGEARLPHLYHPTVVL